MKSLYLIFVFILFYTCAYADVTTKYIYTGIFTISGKAASKDTDFKILNRGTNKKVISQSVFKSLAKLNNDKIVFFSQDSGNADDAISVAIIFTRDDVNHESFVTDKGTFNKYIINAGMNLIIYKPEKDYDDKGNLKITNKITGSLPIAAYSSVIKGAKELTGKEIDQLFIQTASEAFDKKIQNSSIFDDSDRNSDTYQITGFKISSQKAQAILKDKNMASMVSQWFSDYLAEATNATVYPPLTVDFGWYRVSTFNFFQLLNTDGIGLDFEMARAKNQINLDITGLAMDVMNSSSVSTNLIYKAWMQVDIKSQNISKEFDITTVKNVVNNVEKTDEINDIFDLIFALSAKSAKGIAKNE